MSKKYIALIIALFLLPAFLMIGCCPDPDSPVLHPFVTFDPQGGTVSPTDKWVFVGSTYGELPVPVPTKTGLAFIGWYTEKTGGTEVTSSTTVTIDHDHTLYARWSRKPFIG